MRKSKLFSMFMAIFWTMVTALVIRLMMDSGDGSLLAYATLFLSVMCVFVNVVRFYRSGDNKK